jgi:hypothetical protein
MEAYREIIDGNKLASVVDLPEDLRKSEVEVIVLPVKDKATHERKKKTFNWNNLPKHNMGKVLSPLDREHIYTNER